MSLSELTLAKSTKFGDYYYKMETDNDSDSPRKDDNLGTMICFHRNYLLGDHKESKNYADPSAFLESLSGIDTYSDYYERVTDKMSEGQINQWHMKEAEKKNLILPLYLYDHSGISISTGSFGDPWDSGQVGWIYVSHAKIRKEYGWENLTKARLKKIESYLKSEVKTYDDFLTGNVYGYRLFAPTTLDQDTIEDWEGEEDEIFTEIDSCWGFFGSDPEKSGITDHVMNCIDCDISERISKENDARYAHLKQLKNWILAKVNIMYRKPYAG